MVLLDNYPRLKRRVDELVAEAAEAKGAVKEIERRLKEEYKCNDLAAAKLLLKRLGRKRQRLLDEYLAAKKAFESKWEEKLGDVK